MIHCRWAVVALVLTLIVFGLSDVDMAIQNVFYDTAVSGWLIDKYEPISRMLFYTGPKAIIILFGVCCFLVLVFSKWLPWAARRRRALLVVVLSLIVLPSVVGGLKALTNVACPRNLEAFGGTIPHVRLFESYPPDERPEKAQRCFPAGHASGGFALLSLVFLFRTRRAKVLAAGGAFAVGTTLAIYKMAIGDHFLSHTLVTLELGVILVSTIAVATYRFVPRRIDSIR